MRMIHRINARWSELSPLQREKIVGVVAYTLMALAVGGMGITAVLMWFQYLTWAGPIVLIISSVCMTASWIVHGWQDILVGYPEEWRRYEDGE